MIETSRRAYSDAKMWHLVLASLFTVVVFWTGLAVAELNLTDYKTPTDTQQGSFIFPRAFPLTFEEGTRVNFTWASTVQNVSVWIYLENNKDYSIYAEATGVTDKWYEWEARRGRPDKIFTCYVGWDFTYFRSAGFFVNAVSSSSRSSTLRATSTRPATELSGLPHVSTRSSTGLSDPAETTPADGHQYSPPLTSNTQSNLSNGGIAGLTVALCGTATIIAVGLLFVWARRRQHRAAQRRAEKQPVTAVDGPATPSPDELTTSNPRVHDYAPVPHEAERVETGEGTDCVELSALRERPRAEDLDELIS
jgi:hypothetical protein